ncbi:SulP family inorganic anion transporter [Aquimarina agarilytica]|uniref:SulP family inorganic anion transporter n=1 Tax=Aquimarina agarilytica TaxID=1087449 RepID=UPI00028904D9|nr:sulfate permease [Aquimarina agarilytica]
MKKEVLTFQWLRSYKKTHLKGDFLAGITVGILLIPQGMAYALIAGLPPIYGLYAAITPLFIYSFLGTSKRLAVGPVALDALIIASGLSALTFQSVDLYIQAAIIVALIVGVMHLILGFLRLGFLVNFLSKPVIVGFTIAAAITIGFSQLKHILGNYDQGFDSLLQCFINSISLIKSIHFPTFLLGTFSILFLVLTKFFYKKIPAPILLLIISISISYAFNLEQLGISTIGKIPQGLPAFKIPELSYNLILNLLPLALTLAIISFTEAISIAKSLEDKYNENELEPNKELIALGMSNIVGSFFQSFSVTGGFSRTAVNDANGANTKLASLISASTVALVLLFLTPTFYYLPKASLGAIIMVSVAGLINLTYPKELFKNRKDEFAALFLTFLATLFIGIKEGILLGVASSILLMIYRTSRPHMAVLGRVKETSYFKNINRFTESVEIDESILIIRFDAQIYFGNKDFFRKQVLKEINKRKNNVKALILNAESINYIDSTGIYMLRGLLNELHKKQIQLVVAAAIGPIRDIFNKSGLINEIGVSNFFIDTVAAYDFLKQQKPQTKLQHSICLQSKKIEYEN